MKYQQGKQPTPFAVIEEPGYPDGSIVNSEGSLWNCQWDGGCILLYNTEGAIVDRIQMPVKKVTCCCIGGANMDEMFVTTARIADNGCEPEPEAGNLFKV